MFTIRLFFLEMMQIYLSMISNFLFNNYFRTLTSFIIINYLLNSIKYIKAENIKIFSGLFFYP